MNEEQRKVNEEQRKVNESTNQTLRQLMAGQFEQGEGISRLESLCASLQNQVDQLPESLEQELQKKFIEKLHDVLGDQLDGKSARRTLFSVKEEEEPSDDTSTAAFSGYGMGSNGGPTLSSPAPANTALFQVSSTEPSGAASAPPMLSSTATSFASFGAHREPSSSIFQTAATDAGMRSNNGGECRTCLFGTCMFVFYLFV